MKRSKNKDNFMNILKTAIMLVALTFPFSAKADPTVGAGISYVFGEGFAVGLKAFSNDQKNNIVGSIGIDYLLEKNAWRPNFGVGYLFCNDFYSDINAGYNFKTETWNWGAGSGGAVMGNSCKSSRSGSSGSNTNNVSNNIVL